MKNAKRLVLLLALTVSLLRAETFKDWTNEEAATVYRALTSLDLVITKAVPQGDKPAAIVAIPYEFSGKARLVVARNLAALEPHMKALETARAGLVKQLAKGGTEIPETDKEAVAKYYAEMEKVSKDKCPPVNLTKLAIEDLNLDVNKTLPNDTVKKLLPIIKE